MLYSWRTSFRTALSLAGGLWLSLTQAAVAAPLSKANLSQAKRVGVFVGTFDPIHADHISLLETAIKEAGLDYMIVIPVQDSEWQKGNKPDATSFETRLAILMNEFLPNSKVLIPDIPFNPGESLPHEALAYVRAKAPDIVTYSLVGADVAVRLHEIPENLFLRTDRILASKRAGYEVEIPESQRGIPIDTFETVEARAISSTDIRNAIRDKKSFFLDPFKMPPELEGKISPRTLEYIHKFCAYCDPCFAIGRQFMLTGQP